MKEIRYRAKDAFGQWRYGQVAKTKDGWRIFEEDSIDYLIDPETIGESTGYFDKNQSEIFEGDICKNIPDTVLFGKVKRDLTGAWRLWIESKGEWVKESLYELENVVEVAECIK